jgi:hypothetical protein
MGTPYPKAKTLRSKEYLAFIRTHPCCNCGHSAPSEPHHVRFGGNAGTSLKPPDTHTIPVCRDCHDLMQEYRGFDLEIALKTMVKMLSEYVELMEGK